MVIVIAIMAILTGVGSAGFVSSTINHDPQRRL
jgi:hypothetical protein